MEKEQFTTALGITEPVFIDEIVFDGAQGELHIHMNFRRGGKFICPECSAERLPVYDTVDKTWRHLNFWQYKTSIHMRTPRTICPKCGERVWIPPWSRAHSGFTMRFEACVMALAKEMPISRIGELVGEHDTRMWRIVRYHVDKAHAKKSYAGVTQVGCDEISSRKGHNYVTVFANMDNGEVRFATKGKDSDTITAFSQELPLHEAAPEQIKEVTIDMSPAFIRGVTDNLTDARITFDTFHIIQALNRAQDEVRRTEQKKTPCSQVRVMSGLRTPKILRRNKKSC
jgi:transposase